MTGECSEGGFRPQNSPKKKMWKSRTGGYALTGGGGSGERESGGARLKGGYPGPTGNSTAGSAKALPEGYASQENSSSYYLISDKTGSCKLNRTALFSPLQTNGKVETFFKILKREPNEFKDMQDVKDSGAYGGLDYMTPFDKLEKVTELVS